MCKNIMVHTFWRITFFTLNGIPKKENKDVFNGQTSNKLNIYIFFMNSQRNEINIWLFIVYDPSFDHISISNSNFIFIF